jgi:hypothetical protein
MNWKDEGAVIKTKNLLKVFESLGGAGKDLLSALSDLNRTTTTGDRDTLVEKAKEE